MKKIEFIVILLYLSNYRVNSLPGPLVYVVTPSSKSSDSVEGRSAPFYYQNWLRRVDSPQNSSTIVAPTSTSAVKTPDLIFAEFESDNGDNMRKSLRKLLEKERTAVKPVTSSMRPIYVPDDEHLPQNYGLPSTDPKEKTKQKDNEKNDYISIYNNMYNNVPAPVYLPSTTTTPSTTTPPVTTTTSAHMDVQNIWHIIDNEKQNQDIDKWEEVPLNVNNQDKPEVDSTKLNEEQDISIDDNFSLPGFGSKPGNGGENESRAIRTEPNVRFPYVNLKPFVMKNLNKSLVNAPSHNKKDTKTFMNLDNFRRIKNPVRGEIQDVVPIDRYNPAQPYLPPPMYGSKSKQSSPNQSPMKTVANLVPPPPPPSPKFTDNDFPPLSSYDSFPPYAPFNSDDAPSAVPATPILKPQFDSSDSDSGPPSIDDGPIDLGYSYKPPSPPTQKFAPTLPPISKPFKGYSYAKPSLDAPSQVDMDFKGYSYDKPPDSPTDENEPPSPSYHHDHHSESDYPDLIFDNHHGHHGIEDSKDTDDMKDNDMGMMPPPPPPDAMKPGADAMPSMNDNGFPDDFPGDLKYHSYFDDHDFYHHHHHHPTTTTTTTTTTEMPRVNRYSYYYLGKKLYYLPLYFSVYFIVYVGALVIKAVLRHKIVYPNSFRPNDITSSFFSKRSVDEYFSNENLHELTGKVTHAISTAAEKYIKNQPKDM